MWYKRKLDILLLVTRASIKLVYLKVVWQIFADEGKKGKVRVTFRLNSIKCRRGISQFECMFVYVNVYACVCVCVCVCVCECACACA